MCFKMKNNRSIVYFTTLKFQLVNEFFVFIRENFVDEIPC